MTQLKTPYKDLLPPLSTAEYNALEADILTNGINHPIVIDEDDNILDGHNRYRIAPDAPTITMRGLTESEKKATVFRSNNIRRNLSPAQKKAQLKKMKDVALALKLEGKTQADIGSLLGVARQTVGDWLSKKATNANDGIGCIPDSRVVIPKKEIATIIERVESGEKQRQIAADYGVTRQAIAKQVKKAKKKQAKKEAAEIPQEDEDIKALDYDIEIGDVWALGNHRIMCGDVYNTKHLATLTGGTEPSALITDPPYGIGYQPDWNKWDGSPSDFQEVHGDNNSFDPRPFLSYPVVMLFGANYFNTHLPMGGWICWDKRTDTTKDSMIGSPFELAWFRSVHTTKKAIMVRVLHGGVVNADSLIGNNEKRFHPTQKPVEVMRQALEEITKDDDVILDPFAGVGSTLLAAEKTKRVCLSMEIDPEYVSIIIQRWQQMTGDEPWQE